MKATLPISLLWIRLNDLFGLLQGKINDIKWDPTGSWLASCSQDRTVKVTPGILV